MPEYFITPIAPSDTQANREIDALLHAEGIRRDTCLDYTCGIFCEGKLIATGSCFGNTLRCMAVSRAHQGEGLLNQIVTHLTEIQCDRGNTHLFLYTKCDSAGFFKTLGFYEIARIEGQIVFMENRRNGFEKYLKKLKKETLRAVQSGFLPGSAAMKAVSDAPAADLLSEGAATDSLPEGAAIVMNANPFTLGHQYLAETAAKENRLLHLFILSEDQSLIPFSARKKMVLDGTAHLSNIVYHDSGPYIISSTTFPGYFQKSPEAVVESQAGIDLAVFSRIADALSIRSRYVGEEPYSRTTSIYNKIMAEELPLSQIECRILPRKQTGGAAISASAARNALKEGNPDLLRTLVPETTLHYFQSSEAVPVIERIRAAEDVIHH